MDLYVFSYLFPQIFEGVSRGAVWAVPTTQMHAAPPIHVFPLALFKSTQKTTHSEKRRLLKLLS